jgi:catechol 2,3-dioxygenase-like lactoylglutathione lyase family enzyme
MDARITSIALVVKNKAEALEFYTEKVGFEKKTDYTNGGYRYVTVGPKGQDLELALWQEGSPDPIGSSSQLMPGIYPPIVMCVDDVRKLSTELKARGVQFKQEPQEYAWGYRSPSQTRTGTAPRSTNSPRRIPDSRSIMTSPKEWET